MAGPTAERAWVARGTTLCAQALERLDEAASAAPSALPGWTRRHVTAHLAANAEALVRLLHWARTGEPTPMYASAGQRDADIEAGARRPWADLTAWFHASAHALEVATDALPPQAWDAEVVTAQGRTVPATQVPWMRAREVLVHAVDLAAGVTFADLPEDFLVALRGEVTARRAAAGEPVADLRGSLPDLTAHLTGRGSTGVTRADGSPAPAATRWL